jgi:hypothetical protein
MSRPNKSDLEFLFHRLDEMRISDYERLRAKAHLERAYAIADFLAAAVGGVRRLAQRVFLPEARFRPRRRQTSPWVG